MKLFQALKTAAIAAVMGVAMLGVASAAPISGQIQITGGSLVLGGVSPSGPITSLTFNSTANDRYRVGVPTTGSFAVETDEADLVSMTNFIDLANVANPGGNPIWSVGGLVFEATAVLINSYDAATDFYQLILSGVVSGTGAKSGTVYDGTTGVFKLSAQNAVPSIGVSFSSVTAVPLPASVLLLGGALVGMGVAARRRLKVAK